MTTIQLYRKHKAGEISKEKFLYEVRRDSNLPFITNLTSYEDAVKILKNKGVVTDETPAVVGIPAVGLMTEGKKKKEVKELHIDQANPYEYRHGLQHELEQLDEYDDEALDKAKATVLKNLAKDANFYSNLLNAKVSPFEFKKSETDAPGMQANADGTLKKGAGKVEKANVKDNLGKKEEGKKKPKGVKTMPDKGVTGSEKTIKESVEEAKGKTYTIFDKARGEEVETYDTYEDAKAALDKINAEDPYHGDYVIDIDENVEEALPGMASGMHGSKDFQKAMGIEDDSPYKDSAEDEFNSLLSKYDWYYEMSDDPRTYDRGIELDKKLAVLGKQIGVDKAVELFNAKAPSDRKVTSSFFMEGEDKHAKLKETLKAALKKEDIFKKTGTAGGKEDLVVASSPKSKAELTKRGYVRMPGTEDAVGLK